MSFTCFTDCLKRQSANPQISASAALAPTAVFLYYGEQWFLQMPNKM